MVLVEGVWCGHMLDNCNDMQGPTHSTKRYPAERKLAVIVLKLMYRLLYELLYLDLVPIGLRADDVATPTLQLAYSNEL